MNINLVEADEVKVGRAGRTKGDKYGKYAVAIKHMIPTFKDEIGKSKDGFIRIKATDLAKEMGGEFVKKSPTSLIWGVKYLMFHEGIWVETGTLKEGEEKVVIMRLGTEDDVLPKSLRFIEENDENDELEPAAEE